LQPPDVSWNCPFKTRVRQQYEDWMLHGERPLTKGGNPAPPPMSVYLEWIVNAWEKLPRDLIAQSFKTCGIIKLLFSFKFFFIRYYK